MRGKHWPDNPNNWARMSYLSLWWSSSLVYVLIVCSDLMQFAFVHIWKRWTPKFFHSCNLHWENLSIFIIADKQTTPQSGKENTTPRSPPLGVVTGSAIQQSTWLGITWFETVSDNDLFTDHKVNKPSTLRVVQKPKLYSCQFWSFNFIKKKKATAHKLISSFLVIPRYQALPASFKYLLIAMVEFVTKTPMD